MYHCLKGCEQIFVRGDTIALEEQENCFDLILSLCKKSTPSYKLKCYKRGSALFFHNLKSRDREPMLSQSHANRTVQFHMI